MSLPLDQYQTALRVGPRRPMPFPDSGKRVRLLICPRCKMKGLLWWFAPLERGYTSQCIKCGVKAVIKPKDVSLSEIQSTGGFTPTHPLLRERETKKDGTVVYDATKLYDTTRELVDLTYRRAYRRGIVPRVVDEGL